MSNQSRPFGENDTDIGTAVVVGIGLTAIASIICPPAVPVIASASYRAACKTRQKYFMRDMNSEQKAIAKTIYSLSDGYKDISFDNSTEK